MYKQNLESNDYQNPPYGSYQTAEFGLNNSKNENKAPVLRKIRLHKLHGFTVWEVITGVLLGLVLFCIVNGVTHLNLLCFVTLYTVLVGIFCLWGRHLSTVFHFLISLVFLFTICLICAINVVGGYSGNLSEGLPCTTISSSGISLRQLYNTDVKLYNSSLRVLYFAALRKLQEHVELSGEDLQDGTLSSSALNSISEISYEATKCETPRLPSLIVGQTTFSSIGVVVLLLLMFHGWKGTRVPFLYHQPLRNNWKQLEFEGRFRFSFWQMFVGVLGGLSILTIVHLALLDFLVGVPLLLSFVLGVISWIILKRDSVIRSGLGCRIRNSEESDQEYYHDRYLINFDKVKACGYFQTGNARTSPRRIIATALLVASLTAVICISIRIDHLDHGTTVQSHMGLGFESPLVSAIEERKHRKETSENVLGTESPVLIITKDAQLFASQSSQADQFQLSDFSESHRRLMPITSTVENNSSILYDGNVVPNDAAVSAGLMSIISLIVSVVLLLLSIILWLAEIVELPFCVLIITDNVSYNPKTDKAPPESEYEIASNRKVDYQDYMKAESPIIDKSRDAERKKFTSGIVNSECTTPVQENIDELPSSYIREQELSHVSLSPSAYYDYDKNRSYPEQSPSIVSRRPSEKSSSTSERSTITEWWYDDKSENMKPIRYSRSVIKGKNKTTQSMMSPSSEILKGFDASTLFEGDAIEVYDTIENPKRREEIRVPNLIKTVSKLREAAEAQERANKNNINSISPMPSYLVMPPNSRQHYRNDHETHNNARGKDHSNNLFGSLPSDQRHLLSNFSEEDLYINYLGIDPTMNRLGYPLSTEKQHTIINEGFSSLLFQLQPKFDDGPPVVFLFCSDGVQMPASNNYNETQSYRAWDSRSYNEDKPYFQNPRVQCRLQEQPNVKQIPDIKCGEGVGIKDDGGIGNTMSQALNSKNFEDEEIIVDLFFSSVCDAPAKQPGGSIFAQRNQMQEHVIIEAEFDEQEDEDLELLKREKQQKRTIDDTCAEDSAQLLNHHPLSHYDAPLTALQSSPSSHAKNPSLEFGSQQTSRADPSSNCSSQKLQQETGADNTAATLTKTRRKNKLNRYIERTVNRKARAEKTDEVGINETTPIEEQLTVEGKNEKIQRGKTAIECRDFGEGNSHDDTCFRQELVSNILLIHKFPSEQINSSKDEHQLTSSTPAPTLSSDAFHYSPEHFSTQVQPSSAAGTNEDRIKKCSESTQPSNSVLTVPNDGHNSDSKDLSKFSKSPCKFFQQFSEDPLREANPLSISSVAENLFSTTSASCSPVSVSSSKKFQKNRRKTNRQSKNHQQQQWHWKTTTHHNNSSPFDPADTVSGLRDTDS